MPLDYGCIRDCLCWHQHSLAHRTPTATDSTAADDTGRKLLYEQVGGVSNLRRRQLNSLLWQQWRAAAVVSLLLAAQPAGASGGACMLLQDKDETTLTSAAGRSLIRVPMLGRVDALTEQGK